MTNDSQISGNLVGATSFESAAMLTRTAQPGDIDELGHVNNTVYLGWAQDVAVAHWHKVASKDLIERYVWIALRHEIDYRDQVLAGDVVELRTWLGRATGPRFARHVDIRKPGASRFSAKVLTDWCLIDSASRKPKRVDQKIFDHFGVGD